MEEQDCWYFTNGEGDFKYFPNIEITFLEGGRYVWKPEAFLYETEQRNVYCSTIVLRTQEAEERNLRAEREPRSARREASENENPSNTIMPRYFIEDNHENDLSVLGVTFFIDHDLIFDISGWRLGMVQADCLKQIYQNDYMTHSQRLHFQDQIGVTPLLYFKFLFFLKLSKFSSLKNSSHTF